jgi:hypothetical protein
MNILVNALFNLYNALFNLYYSNGNLGMWINYKFKPSLVKRIIHVAHKGKKRNYRQSLHEHHV